MTLNEFINSGFITKINELLVGAENKKKEIQYRSKKLKDVDLAKLIEDLPEYLVVTDLNKIDNLLNKINNLSSIKITDFDTKLNELINTLKNIENDIMKTRQKQELKKQIDDIIKKLDESVAQQENYISDLKKIQELYKKINYKYIDKDVIEELCNEKGDKDISDLNLQDIIFKLNLIVDDSVKSKEQKEKEEKECLEKQLIEINKLKDNIMLYKISFIVFFVLFLFLIYASYYWTEKILQTQLKYIYFLILFVILGFILSLYQRITKLSDEKKELNLLLNLSGLLDTKTIKHRIESYLKNKLRN